MDVKVHFTNIDPSETVIATINEKVLRFKKYFAGKFNVHWNCSVEKEDHTSSVTIVGKGIEINAHATSDNLYKTIDSALEKLEKQLLRKKEVVTNKHHAKVINVSIQE